MNLNIKTYVVLLIFTLIIDLTVINIFFRKNWEKTIKNIQKDKMKINVKYALITYFLIPLGLLLFVYPKIDNKSWVKSSLLYGFLFGIVTYGIFDFTNLGLFNDYPLNIALIDTVWGGILCAIVSLLTYSILNKWFKK